MDRLRVFVETSDKYNWLLKPFAYFFNMYWSKHTPCVVFGYTPPDFELPPNFQFFSIDSYNYPAEHWSDGFIKFILSVTDEHFVVMLADYWLCRHVNIDAVMTARDYMHVRPDIVRFDLTDDRLHSGRAFDVESYGCYDIIETPVGTPYQFSLQAAVWNRENLLSLLVPNRTPWETEINTAVPSGMRVLGTRQIPIRYANAVLKGKLDWDQLKRIRPEQLEHVLPMVPDRLRG